MPSSEVSALQSKLKDLNTKTSLALVSRWSAVRKFEFNY